MVESSLIYENSACKQYVNALVYSDFSQFSCGEGTAGTRSVTLDTLHDERYVGGAGAVLDIGRQSENHAAFPSKRLYCLRGYTRDSLLANQ